MSAVAALVQQKLEQKGLSVRDLAYRAGLTPSAVYKILAGERDASNVLTVQKLARGLGIDPMALMTARAAEDEVNRRASGADAVGPPTASADVAIIDNMAGAEVPEFADESVMRLATRQATRLEEEEAHLARLFRLVLGYARDDVAIARHDALRVLESYDTPVWRKGRHGTSASRVVSEALVVLASSCREQGKEPPGMAAQWLAQARDLAMDAGEHPVEWGAGWLEVEYHRKIAEVRRAPDEYDYVTRQGDAINARAPTTRLSILPFVEQIKAAVARGDDTAFGDKTGEALRALRAANDPAATLWGTSDPRAPAIAPQGPGGMVDWMEAAAPLLFWDAKLRGDAVFGGDPEVMRAVAVQVHALAGSISAATKVFFEEVSTPLALAQRLLTDNDEAQRLEGLDRWWTAVEIAQRAGYGKQVYRGLRLVRQPGVTARLMSEVKRPCLKCLSIFGVDTTWHLVDRASARYVCTKCGQPQLHHSRAFRTREVLANSGGLS